MAGCEHTRQSSSDPPRSRSSLFDSPSSMTSHSPISSASTSSSFPASSSPHTSSTGSSTTSTSPPSTASSLTAFSHSGSNPSHQASKKLPFPTIRLINDDHEKSLPGRGAGVGPTSSIHARTSSLGRYGWRKRRARSQTLMFLGVLGIVGLWLGRNDLPGYLGIGNQPGIWLGKG